MLKQCSSLLAWLLKSSIMLLVCLSLSAHVSFAAPFFLSLQGSHELTVTCFYVDAASALLSFPEWLILIHYMSYRFFPLLFFWHFSVVTVYKCNCSFDIMKHVAAFFLKNRCFWRLSWNVIVVMFWFCCYCLYRTSVNHISIFYSTNMVTEGDPTALAKVLHLLVLSFSWGMQVWVTFIAGTT